MFLGAFKVTISKGAKDTDKSVFRLLVDYMGGQKVTEFRIGPSLLRRAMYQEGSRSLGPSYIWISFIRNDKVAIFYIIGAPSKHRV